MEMGHVQISRRKNFQICFEENGAHPIQAKGKFPRLV